MMRKVVSKILESMEEAYTILESMEEAYTIPVWMEEGESMILVWMVAGCTIREDWMVRACCKWYKSRASRRRSTSNKQRMR
jgi:hypothetical protein